MTGREQVRHGPKRRAAAQAHRILVLTLVELCGNCAVWMDSWWSRALIGAVKARHKQGALEAEAHGLERSDGGAALGMRETDGGTALHTLTCSAHERSVRRRR